MYVFVRVWDGGVCLKNKNIIYVRYIFIFYFYFNDIYL